MSAHRTRTRKRPTPSKRDEFYLSKAEQTHLENILDEVPGLAADLAVAITMQARLGDRSRGSKHPSVHPMLVDLRAVDVSAELQSALVTTTRLVCEQRSIEFMPVGYHCRHGEMIGPLRESERRLPAGYDESAMPCQARWLKRNMMSLCLTEGADSCHAEIDKAFKSALRVVWPPYRPIVLDMDRVQEARGKMLSASRIAELAPKLGEEYRNLTVRRIQYLNDEKKINQAPGPWRITHYILGEVLEAHLSVPVRRKHAAMS